MSDKEQSAELEQPVLPSFSPAVVVLLSCVIFFLGPVIGKTLALALAGVLVTSILWQSLSIQQYQKMKQFYPQMQRSFWIVNKLVYHLIIPIVILGLVYLFFKLIA